MDTLIGEKVQLFDGTLRVPIHLSSPIKPLNEWGGVSVITASAEIKKVQFFFWTGYNPYTRKKKSL